MISFPTTLNRGGSHLITPQQSNSLKDVWNNSIRSSFNSAISKATSGHGYDTDGIRYDEDPDKNKLIDSMDFSSQTEIPNASNMLAPNSTVSGKQVQIWSPFKMSQGIFSIVNNYRGYMDNVLIETGNDSVAGKDLKHFKTHNYKGKVIPSLFNPYNGVPYGGIMENVPLLDGTSGPLDSGNTDINEIGDLSNCSINELVKLSSQSQSILGQARYKYTDFMYCKDLGKVANNHMITLRKFATPVGDNIFKEAVGKKEDPTSQLGDIGRLITWFDTDDNKLSDIMSYEYEATWKELNSKIDQQNSQEDDEARGPMGKIINNLNPSYNAQAGAGVASGGWISQIMTKIGLGSDSATYANNDVALGRNYDKNKVYEPKNTIQDTHIYEGKLKFKHEFTLTFSYKLRAYDNINPKSAFLDLIGNILMVTYKRGTFWAGRNEILGAKPNRAGWNKYNNIMKGISSAGGALWTNIFHLDGATNPSILGSLGQFANDICKAVGFNGKELLEKAQGFLSDAVTDPVGAGQTIINKTKEGVQKAAQFAKDSNLGSAFFGSMMNKLGRPSLYAFDSLLNGNYVGLWHVTIGNPKNPIATFGNLILTNAKITHSGPLGLDDFPTDLKVTVTLKHAMSRDSVGIERMYTKGRNGIYLSLASPFTKVAYSDGKSTMTNDEDAKKSTPISDAELKESEAAAAKAEKEAQKEADKKKTAKQKEAEEKAAKEAMDKAMKDLRKQIVADMEDQKKIDTFNALNKDKINNTNADVVYGSNPIAKEGTQEYNDGFDNKMTSDRVSALKSAGSPGQYTATSLGITKPIVNMSRYSWCGCDIQEFTSNKDELR